MSSSIALCWATAASTRTFSHQRFCAKPIIYTCPRVAQIPTAVVQRTQIPTILTWTRIAAIPTLVAVYLPAAPSSPLLSTLLFSAASFTDFLDGYLARRWKCESPLGKFLDPVADKLMVAAALCLVTARASNPIITLASLLILCREIFVSALREWMAILGKSNIVQVSSLGKIKTTVQMISIVVLLYSAHVATNLRATGISLLAVAAALSWYSAIDYIRGAIGALSKKG